MDYPIFEGAPDVAQAVMPHILQAGSARPQSLEAPGPVAGPLIARATATPEITASSAYASGNAVGALLTFAGMARADGQGGVLQTAILRDKAGQNVPYDLFLFDAAPAAPTDKSAVALADADLAKCIGVVSFAGVVLGASAGKGIFTAAGLALGYKLDAGTALYGILVTRGTPTYGGTSDVTVDLIVLPD